MIHTLYAITLTFINNRNQIDRLNEFQFLNSNNLRIIE